MTDDVDEGDETRSPLGGYLTLPVRFAHELTHLGAALPFVDRWELRVSDARADIEVSWRERPPTLWYVFVFLAPTVFGVMIVSAVAWELFRSGANPLPSDVLGALEWAVFGLAWMLFTWPSRADRRGALEVLRGEE